MHFFMLDTGYDNGQINRNEDGVAMTSKMAAWLRVALARSLSPWKIVVGHHPPFSSATAMVSTPTLDENGKLSYPELRWPFKAWGAHMYINGHVHAYERIIKGEFPYITNGSGASTLINSSRLTDPIDGSAIRYVGDYGAQRLIATCETLTSRFYNTDGTLVDEYELTK
jgi:hypothetical protein